LQESQNINTEQSCVGDNWIWIYNDKTELKNVLLEPGTDVAGEVVGLGLGVTTFSLGDKVVSCLGTVRLLFLFAPIQTKWTCRVKAPGWGHSQNKRPRTRC
jgi:NADPH:quinone reductase-like Zn-dependent oxidoreductase